MYEEFDTIIEMESEDDIIYGSLVSVALESEAVYCENFITDYFSKNGRDTRAKNDFKKRYNFQVLDPKHPDIGSITFNDGKQYLIDLGTSQYVVLDAGGESDRSTMADLTSKDAKIFIDDAFWSLNKNEREAVIAHEIGHQNMHSLNIDNKNLDKRFISMGTFRRMICEELQMKISPRSLSFIFRIFWLIFRQKIAKILARYCININNKPSDTDKLLEDIRKQVIEPYVEEFRKQLRAAGCITAVEDQHLSALEIEADVFAVNHSKKHNPKYLKSALNKLSKADLKYIKQYERELERDYANKKITKSEYDEGRERIEQAYKIIKEIDIETKARYKAMKDKKIVNSEFYK